MNDLPISETDAQIIIDVLHKYGLPEQVSCLMSMIFSHVVAACGQDMTIAEGVMQRVIQTMPRQWEVTKGLMQMESMQPTAPLN